MPQKCICLLQREDTAGDFNFHHYSFKMLYNEQKHYRHVLLFRMENYINQQTI